jgi:hypothetical protein
MKSSLYLLYFLTITQTIYGITPNGTKLMNFINCFAWYLTDAAHRPDNSQTLNCNQDDILYCKTDSGRPDDHLCKFDGTNILIDDYTQQECYFNCQMETCNAWNVAHDDNQQTCINTLNEN